MVINGSALLLQTKFQINRWAGFLRCPQNVVVILKKGESLPIANRIYVKTLLEMRGKGFFRVVLISILGYCLIYFVYDIFFIFS